MKVSYQNLVKSNSSINKILKSEFAKVLKSGWYVLGKNVDEFESEYANFNNTKYCIGVANGLEALILSLKSLNITNGDEVIVPSNTYIASWLAVSYVGAIPIPVEPNWITCNIDVSLIESKITNQTKAIMAVNLYGQAAELNKIDKICKKYKLHLIEDNAQSQGAECMGQLTGSWGIINATSFYPGKNLGALGDAGAITTNSIKLYKNIKMLRNYGSEIKYYNNIKGTNSRLDEIQAAFLKIKLKNLIEQNIERQKIAEIYNQNFSNLNQIQLTSNANNCTSVYHIYQIRTNKRDDLQNYLNRNQIGTIIHYPIPPHLQKAYKELNYKLGSFPIAEKIAKTTLSIPLRPGLLINEIDYIIKKVKSYFR